MAKVENYTLEQATELKAAYVASVSDEARAAVVAEFAEKFGKVSKSVIAKLSRMGVYRKATVTGKRGGVKKADIVTAIVDAVPMPENDASSLEKATVGALKAIKDALLNT